MNNEARDRLLLPLVLPAGIIAFALLVIFLLSRILLAVSDVNKDAATPIALVGALAILFGSAFFATRRRIEKWQVYTAILLPVLALVIGGTYASTRLEGGTLPKKEKAESAAEKVPSAGTGQLSTSVTVTAQDNSFDKTELVVPAGQEFTITMKNNGQAPHNVHIFDKQGGNSIAATEPLAIPSGQSGSLKAKIDSPGTYFYQCDFHLKEMTGKLTVR